MNVWEFLHTLSLYHIFWEMDDLLLFLLIGPIIYMLSRHWKGDAYQAAANLGYLIFLSQAIWAYEDDVKILGILISFIIYSMYVYGIIILIKYLYQKVINK